MRGLIAASAAFLLLTGSAQAGVAGGAEYKVGKPKVMRVNAKRLPHGRAAIPLGAPLEVQELVKRGNRLVGKPYVWGGGHDPDFGLNSPGYDCSGSTSFVLRKLLDRPLVSGALAGWGMPGKGKWVTIYANGHHVFIVVAGLRFDTSSVGDHSGYSGPRWRPRLRSTAGFVARHPGNL